MDDTGINPPCKTCALLKTQVYLQQGVGVDPLGISVHPLAMHKNTSEPSAAYPFDC